MISKEDFNRVLNSPPYCTLGKNGISEEFIKHITSLLKRYKIIKIKALKNIATKSNIDAIAEEIAQKTNSFVLDVRGKKIIIARYQLQK